VGDVKFTFIPGRDNVADVLPDPLTPEPQLKHCENVGLRQAM
jgi:hypothetical protein